MGVLNEKRCKCPKVYNKIFVSYYNFLIVFHYLLFIIYYLLRQCNKLFTM